MKIDLFDKKKKNRKPDLSSDKINGSTVNALNPRADLPGGESSAPPGKTDKEAVGRSREDYFKNYIITSLNIGQDLFSLIKIAEGSADDITELSPTEDRYLDEMIFNGYVSHKMYIREGFPVTFRSVPMIANLRGRDIILNEKGISNKMDVLESIMAISVYLESYGNPAKGISLSHVGLTQPEFMSVERIKERYDFCCEKLSGIVLDTIKRRLSEFLDLLSRIASSQNIKNFSSAP
ncbi:MAG: hypothetical protein WCY30_00060 [Candidatus Neomarinimicrobiota bacterium]|jgi:hypothetical protein